LKRFTERKSQVRPIQAEMEDSRKKLKKKPFKKLNGFLIQIFGES